LQEHGDDVENPDVIQHCTSSINVGHDVQKNIFMNEGVASGGIGKNIDDL
jgi:hypothetical protein